MPSFNLGVFDFGFRPRVEPTTVEECKGREWSLFIKGDGEVGPEIHIPGLTRDHLQSLIAACSEALAAQDMLDAAEISREAAVRDSAPVGFLARGGVNTEGI